MHLRRLELKDAPLMLSWMHDKSVTENMFSDFSSKTLKDAEDFILASLVEGCDLNLAIASDADEYMGTVSLKHINDGKAEFAIAVRSEAMGRGYAWFAMESIIKMAFDQLGLESVYWCVSRRNSRAIRFYDKHHFSEVVDVPEDLAARYKAMEDLKWYSVLKGDRFDIGDSVAGCRVVHIRTVPTIDSGELSFFEASKDISFEIKRIYYISKVPEGVRRGFHAHKELKQFLFCPYGCIRLLLENKNGREEIELSDPSVGILIEEPTWREMLWIRKDSVLCVAASDYYDPEDYIRDYDEFIKYIRKNC